MFSHNPANNKILLHSLEYDVQHLLKDYSNGGVLFIRADNAADTRPADISVMAKYLTQTSDKYVFIEHPPEVQHLRVRHRSPGWTKGKYGLLGQHPPKAQHKFGLRSSGWAKAIVHAYKACGLRKKLGIFNQLSSALRSFAEAKKILVFDDRGGRPLPFGLFKHSAGSRKPNIIVFLTTDTGRRKNNISGEYSLHYKSIACYTKSTSVQTFFF